MNMINQLEIQELIDKLIENGYGEIVTDLLENENKDYTQKRQTEQKRSL